MIWPQERSREALDGLLILARAALRSSSPERVPATVVELIEALASDASDFGSGRGGGARLDGMEISNMLAPDAAGQVVGLSGRRVRQLCGEGAVRFVRSGVRGYLVDVADLQRHMSEGST